MGSPQAESQQAELVSEMRLMGRGRARGDRRGVGSLEGDGAWVGVGQQRIVKTPFQAQTLPMPLVQATDITIWAAAPVQ